MSTAFSSLSVPSSPSVSPSPRGSWRSQSKQRVMRPSNFANWDTGRKQCHSRSQSRSPFRLSCNTFRSEGFVNDFHPANRPISLKKSPLNCSAASAASRQSNDRRFSRMKNALPSQSELFAQNFQQIPKPLSADRCFRNRRPSKTYKRPSRSPTRLVRSYNKYRTKSGSPPPVVPDSPSSVVAYQKIELQKDENEKAVDTNLKYVDISSHCYALVQNLPANADWDQVLQTFSRFNASEVCFSSDGWRITFSNISNRDAAVREMNGSKIFSHVIAVKAWNPIAKQKIDDVVHEYLHTSKQDVFEYESRVPNECMGFIFEALLQTSVEQAWRDNIEAPIFRYLEEWAGKSAPESPKNTLKCSNSSNQTATPMISNLSVKSTKAESLTTVFPSAKLSNGNVESHESKPDRFEESRNPIGRQPEAFFCDLLECEKQENVGSTPQQLSNFPEYFNRAESISSMNNSPNELLLTTNLATASNSIPRESESFKTEPKITEKPNRDLHDQSSDDHPVGSPTDSDKRIEARNKRGRPSGSTASHHLKNSPRSTSSPSCSFCGADDDQDQIALCWVDHCQSALHIYCMAPPLRRVPRQWLCDMHLGTGSGLSVTSDCEEPDDDEYELKEWRPTRRLRDQREVRSFSSNYGKVAVADSVPVHEYGCVRAAGIMLHYSRKKSRTSTLNADLTEADCFQNSRRSDRIDRRRLSAAISSSAYPPLQLNSLTSRKKNLQLFRSAIHAWGVRTLEPLYEGDLVVEYIGECVSSHVADIREKRYERIGIGSSYFFKISDDLIIDATRKGNLARYINHSCTPNCKTKVVTVGNSQRIAIYAKQHIPAGEELCYDYKFPSEPDEHKIPCWCGTKRCRGYLN